VCARKKAEMHGIYGPSKNARVKLAKAFVVEVCKKFLTTPIKLDPKIRGLLPQPGRTVIGLVGGLRSLLEVAKNPNLKTLVWSHIGGAHLADGMRVTHVCSKCLINLHLNRFVIGDQG
jgi:hypothetical protein